MIFKLNGYLLATVQVRCFTLVSLLILPQHFCTYQGRPLQSSRLQVSALSDTCSGFEGPGAISDLSACMEGFLTRFFIGNHGTYQLNMNDDPLTRWMMRLGSMVSLILASGGGYYY